MTFFPAKHLLTLLFLGIFVFLGHRPLLGQKTDIIMLENGNVITGEIKKLEYGKLTYSTDDLGKIQVNWNKVVSIQSDKIFEIETTQGYLIVGRLEETTDTGNVFVRAGPAGTEVRLIDITFIYPIKSRFIQRISGPVNIGAGYTKANQLMEVTFDGDLNYRGKLMYSVLGLSGSFTRQYDTLYTRRQQYNFGAGKKFKKHWYLGGIIGYEQNSELGIQTRLNLGILAGNEVLQNTSNSMNTFVAVQGTREYYYSDKPTANNIELFFNIKYKHFLYYSPKSDITTELQFLPSLTSWGRIRSNFSVMFKQEIFSDFFISIQSFIYYDNKPPDEKSTNIDWAISTGLGYTF